MSFDVWLGFCALVVLVVSTPGPSVLIGMSHSMRYGIKPVMITALGDVTANMIQMVIAAVGLGAILATSESAFAIVKWAGVAFLMGIGLMAFLRKPTPANPENNDTETKLNHGYEAARPGRLFGDCFLVAAGNPKAIAFFGALFPQFIDAGSPLAPQLFILGATFVIFDYSLVMIYAMGAARLMPWLKRRGGNNVIGRVSGVVLILAAVILSLIDTPQSIARES